MTWRTALYEAKGLGVDSKRASFRGNAGGVKHAQIMPGWDYHQIGSVARGPIIVWQNLGFEGREEDVETTRVRRK